MLPWLKTSIFDCFSSSFSACSSAAQRLGLSSGGGRWVWRVAHLPLLWVLPSRAHTGNAPLLLKAVKVMEVDRSLNITLRNWLSNLSPPLSLPQFWGIGQYVVFSVCCSLLSLLYFLYGFSLGSLSLSSFFLALPHTGFPWGITIMAGGSAVSCCGAIGISYNQYEAAPASPQRGCPMASTCTPCKFNNDLFFSSSHIKTSPHMFCALKG